jgi:hypothetical protein
MPNFAVNDPYPDPDLRRRAHEILLSRQELARRWGVSAGRLANDASQRRGCVFLKLSPGTVRYRLVDVEEYERAALVGTLDQPAAQRRRAA